MDRDNTIKLLGVAAALVLVELAAVFAYKYISDVRERRELKVNYYGSSLGFYRLISYCC
jgi:hypothetical protein